MPRKPTLIARQAKLELRRLVSLLSDDSPLPTMQELGKRCDLHPSTMFRMLKDLANEGIVWQSPLGKFYAAGARKHILKGAPLCFIGREMWPWFGLYEKILDGVSEVCMANGSPFILFSAPSLVRQSDPTSPPEFASPESQQKELAALLGSVPRGCGGFILDHLWSGDVLASASFPGGERIQLLAGSDQGPRVIAPDYQAGARLVREHLQEQNFQQAVLILPFAGDSAIEATNQALREELMGFPLHEVPFSELGKVIRHIKASPKKKTCLLCSEGNTALAVSAHLAGSSCSKTTALIATQGTGMEGIPGHYLRYDCRRLGRAAAIAVFEGTDDGPVPPSLQIGC